MSIRVNVVANHLGQGWAALVALVCLPLYVRYLGIEAFGIIGAFTILQAALSLFDVPLAASVNREMARYTAGAHTPASIRAVLRTLEWLCGAVGIAVIVVVFGTRSYLAESWFQATAITPESMRSALLAMAIVASLRLGEGLYRGALYGLQRQVAFSVSHAVLSTLRFGGALVIVALFSPTLEAFFLWQAAISASTVLVLSALVYRRLPPTALRARWSWAVFADLRQFTGGVMGITVIALALTQADKVILSRMLTLESFGYYTLAVTVSNALYKLSEPIMDAVYPRLTELVAAGDAGRLVALYHHTAQLVTVCTVPAALVLTVFADGVISMWTGDARLASRTAPVLRVFAAGVCLNCLMTVPYRLQLAHGWTALTFTSNVLYLALLLPALLWVAPRYGPVGAASLWTALNVAYVTINIPMMHKRLLTGELWRYYSRDVIVPAAAALVVVVIARSGMPHILDSRVTWLLFLGVVGGAALIAATLTAPPLRREIPKLYRWAVS